MDKQDKFYRKLSNVEKQLKTADFIQENLKLTLAEIQNQRPACDHIVEFVYEEQGGSIRTKSGKTFDGYTDEVDVMSYKPKVCPEC